MSFTLNEVTIKAPKKFQCHYFMPPGDETEQMDILVVAFSGTYPEGSSGNAHGNYIAWQTMYGLHAFEPQCVILDFREMNYVWGNTLYRVFQDIDEFKNGDMLEDEPEFPILMAVSDKCEAGILSLMTPATDESLEHDWIFRDIDLAVAQGVILAKEWLFD